MSKKKHRHKGEREINNNSGNRVNNNAPFGINPAQLMSMFGGNMDMGQIGNVLSSMKMDGLDLNNFNLGQFGNNQQGRSGINNRSGFDLGALQGMMNNLGMGNFNLGNNNTNLDSNSNFASSNDNNFDITDIKSDTSDNSLLDDDLLDDENIQMLIAIKSIVDSKKAKFIDKVIEAYNNGYFKE
ncbi:hypothetical protein NSA50_09735 [Clostridium sp. DSM 100503]|uniref:hypothetical protein n=1 Tax=Clostridium sp. DSM 100503 TaxID=2963282 RepID=UPI00214A4789|nr:hypothetical protein [Clostridium sp. DSM 100503]MCR1951329.1 hypothetical protein [Clostridium sp. DSM 100503]